MTCKDAKFGSRHILWGWLSPGLSPHFARHAYARVALLSPGA